jgi:HupE / UreJ protein
MTPRHAFSRPFAALFIWLVLALPALAHKPSDSYLSLKVEDSKVSGQWDIALRDLDHAIGLDADGNGEITWGELRARHEEIAAHALARLSVSADGAACTLRAAGQLVDEHTDGAYTVLPFTAECPSPPTQRVSLEYRLFADIDPQHRGLLRLEAAGLTQTAIFSPQAASQSFELTAPSHWTQFVTYVEEGIWHIWIGFDHILFLLSLLLPAVLVWRRPRWWPVENFRAAFIDVLKIVTSFTVAHSITLSLATLGLVSLPSRLVESAIAASVVVAALNNVFSWLHGRRWAAAFLFGLVHGFGFASVLADLGLPQGTLALALVGFNLGVEVGQLAIVAVFLPLAYALRHTLFYRRGVLVGGSLLIALVAAIWLSERLFEFKLLPF